MAEAPRAVHLLDAAPDAIVAADTSGVIVLVNQQVEALFGYHRDELVGKHIEVLLPLRIREGHVGLRSGFVETPAVRPMGGGEVLHALRKDGSEFPAEISLSPVRHEGRSADRRGDSRRH